MGFSTTELPIDSQLESNLPQKRLNLLFLLLRPNLILVYELISAECGQIQTRILVHPDGNSLTNDIFFWHGSPLPAICTIIPVVPHHEIMS